MIPTGIVTFLFTDIEGSTKLAQEHHEILNELLDKHNGILKNEMESNEGFVFDFTGDGYCCSFENPDNALKAAVKIQLNLAKEKSGGAEVKVRIGIHSGKAEWNGNKYMGYITLARTARVMSAAYGEQILLSGETHRLLSENVLYNYKLKDLGERKLKDLISPLRLYQVEADGLRTEFPQLKTLDARPNNLPVQLTSFIGRKEEIKTIKDLIKKHRLLTFTGSGGAGKTRLALQAGAELIDEFDNGVWITELASVLDSESVIPEIMQSLGISENPQKKAEDTLMDFLKEKVLMLIIDNCEHLIESVASACHLILTKCPKVKIITTSREALRCDGEHTHMVLPLEYPDPMLHESPEALTQYESVRLFIERALAVNSNFRVTNENAPSLAQICFQLDGIPLAIELAAAKTKILTIEQIQKRLDSRFTLLTGGRRTALPRQQTLKALIDWSYDLITEDEKILWNRLSVFSGGWTLEAAEEICSDNRINRESILELLLVLSEKSIIIFNLEKEHYKMLETIRQYGIDKLKSSDDFEIISDNHLKYYSQFAEKARGNLRGDDAAYWINCLNAESGNFEKALIRFSETGNTEYGLKLIQCLSYYWQIQGKFTEGLRWFDLALSRYKPDEYPILYKIMATAGNLIRLKGDIKKSKNYMEKALEYFRKVNNSDGITEALNKLGIIGFDEGKYEEAIKYYEECMEIYISNNNMLGLSTILNNLGNAWAMVGYMEKAYEYHQKSLAIRREIKDRFGIAYSLHNLGIIENDNREFENAKKFHEESLQIRRELGNRTGIAFSLEALGNVNVSTGNYTEAEEQFNESLNIFKSLGEKMGIAGINRSLGNLSFNQENYEKALDYFSRSFEIGKEMGIDVIMAEAIIGIGDVKLEKNEFAEARDNYIHCLKLLNNLGDNKFIIQTVLRIAELFLILKKFKEAARLTGFAENHLLSSKIRLTKKEQSNFDNLINELKKSPDEKSLKEFMDEGKEMKLTELISTAEEIL